MNAPYANRMGPVPFKLRVSDFELLDKAGAFEGRYKVELIEGTLVAMNAEYRLHGVVKNRIVRRLQRALEAGGSTMEALNEVSVKLDDANLPQPDAVIAHVATDRRYFTPADIALTIEVSDRSIRSDLTRKVALYAAADIPELWVVDARGARVHRFWSVRDGGYAETDVHHLDGELRSATIPGLAIDGTGIL